jgi:Fe-S cluster assembly iron-binding protein IscA
MLVLTTAAAEVVKAVTTAPEAPAGAGLRIAASAPQPQSAGSLQVTAAEGPGEGDQVLEGEGARVFLEPEAALYLEDKVLDARMDEQGNAHFTLGEQTAGEPGAGEQGASQNGQNPAPS